MVLAALLAGCGPRDPACAPEMAPVIDTRCTVDAAVECGDDEQCLESFKAECDRRLDEWMGRCEK